jgi:hypothetical protein
MIKPGYTTTEFYVTLLSYLLSVIAMFKSDLPVSMPDYIQAAALLASGAATIIYTHSRQQIKTAAANQPVSPTYSTGSVSTITTQVTHTPTEEPLT